MKAGDKRDCPKCKGVAINITPLKSHDPKLAVFACQACGFTFKENNSEFLETAGELRDYFRGATQGNQALLDLLGGKTVPAATRALLMARLIEYGTQMWFDGLKQGLLLGAVKEEHGKVQHGQGSIVTEPEERGSPTDAGSSSTTGQPSKDSV